ncbi:hypothetical protein LQV05_003204 [Cryptococcus neoformans]|nr:hypothetical protein J007_02481 [Cryptococcus neoformans var. grubii]OXC62052.1 hypothetical protein C358_02540 [Cryptococcus neoformans var. grubii MW-RSA852]UOH80550.1 hypothetical protein LQV05_003204 [Cryptococcus neoformans]
MAQSTESPLPPPWTLPPCIAPRLVYPDISPAVLSKNGASGPVGDDQQQQQKEIVGKDSDPGRMGVWVCLLHDKPLLYPSLIALHKHRHASHGIPIPAGGPAALPEPQTPAQARAQEGATDATGNPTASTAPGDILPKEVVEVLQQLQADTKGSDVDVKGLSSTSGCPRQNGNADVRTDISEEWFTWKFTEEEEARRRAYLPLA